MKRLFSLLLCFFLIVFSINDSLAQRKKKKDEEPKVENPLDGFSLSTFKFRSVGPALTSGRIADIVVNPDNIAEFYVAAAAGGVWKTTNAGTTFKPIFDNYGSYSIGALAMDPTSR